MVDLEDMFHEKQSILKELSLAEDWLEEVREELDDPNLEDWERESLYVEEQEYLDAINQLEHRLQSL